MFISFRYGFYELEASFSSVPRSALQGIEESGHSFYPDVEDPGFEHFKFGQDEVHHEVSVTHSFSLGDYSSATNVRLSPREQEVLAWAARGKSAWETAGLLGLSESTVKFYLRNACKRLCAQNRTHAVAISIVKGLLDDPTS